MGKMQDMGATNAPLTITPPWLSICAKKASRLVAAAMMDRPRRRTRCQGWESRCRGVEGNPCDNVGSASGQLRSDRTGVGAGRTERGNVEGCGMGEERWEGGCASSRRERPGGRTAGWAALTGPGGRRRGPFMEGVAVCFWALPLRLVLRLGRNYSQWGSGP